MTNLNIALDLIHINLIKYLLLNTMSYAYLTKEYPKKIYTLKKMFKSYLLFLYQ